ncbi:hypothetical protein MNV49_003716 [Pseudohyphozyma bogoriensis]|nr:hypothetical protein MNV49_003716 [Pseudohyphozyma bogoriensis]
MRVWTKHRHGSLRRTAAGKARGKASSGSTRSRSVGSDHRWNRERRQHDDLFRLDVEFDSSEDSSGPPTPSTPSSSRSTPEPSECEFDLRLAGTKFSPSRSPRSAAAHQPPSPSFLSRRHTLPRRKRVRTPSISFALVTSEHSAAPPSPSLLAPLDPRPQFQHDPESPIATPTLVTAPITTTASILTFAVSISSRFASAYPVIPASPVHLLRPDSLSHRLVEYTNALLAPFLISTSSTSALALGIANLATFKSLEDDHATRGTASTKTALVTGLWVAIVAVRVLLSWVFGRVLGWAHPELFSTTAIHQVGSGLAPLLLTLCIVRAYTNPASTPGPLSFQAGLLAANFATPIEQGGTGLWWGLSAVVVGLAVCAGIIVYEAVQSLAASRPTVSASTSPSTSTNFSLSRFAPLFSLLLLPFLVSYEAPPPSHDLSNTFSTLHPAQDNLLTVLLLTAPRPGNPDFLFRTIESWLDALPSPTTSPTLETSRLRMIVFTHFRTHDMFDAAQTYFAESPSYATKAEHYIEWRRDPRGHANRLDQRLHVARALAYAAESGGDSAYVLLAEDDFPLCADAGETWVDLKRAIVETNLAMPDWDTRGELAMSYEEQEEASGHCGLFLATGGSGLAMRGFVAAKLPGLLLGAEDADGALRDARAERGEWTLKHEDEGADTPDLVIQDCLRGRVAGCEVCAPPTVGSGRMFPKGSKRNAFGGLGDRWGKSGLAGTERLMQRHLGYNASTLPGRKYGKEEWSCGWRQPFNGEPDVLVV